MEHRERRGEIGGTRRPGPDRHKLWHWLWRVDWAWRRVVPLIALGLAMIAVFGLQDKIDRTQAQVEAQREGRRVAREVLCGGLYGVQEAGRLILLGELPPPAPKTPPVSTREHETRERFAESYAAVISRRVLEVGGIKAEGVLRDDGTIDCDALNMLSVDPSEPGG